jgi:hypothetical protein
MIRICMVLTMLLVFPGQLLADGHEDGLTAKAIMDKVTDQDRMGFDAGEARMKLIIQNKKGQKRIRTVNSKSIKVDDMRWTLVTFLEPVDVAGTKMLSKEVKDGSDIQYLYLPGLKEKRRIAGSAKNDSFMGTDFSYNDLEQKSIEDSQHARQTDEQHSGLDCFKIESTPTDGESEYSKLEVWVDKQDYLPLKIYFYDKKGNHYKTLIAQVVEPIDGEVTITKLMMKNVKKGSKTIMQLEALDRSKKFPKSLFDESKLDK